MDPLTHTLTGLMLSRTGLGRVHPRAPLALMLAANAPDLDGLSLFGGALSYIHYHRGLPHAVVAVPFMAILPVLVVCGAMRNFRGWRSLYLVCFIGVVSHLLLDWTNAYGVRFGLPFTSEWFHLDINTLVDFWILAALLIGWLMVYVMRLVSSEIGARPGSGRGLAIFALSFFLIYDFGKYLLHQRALTTLNARIYDGAVPSRTGAFAIDSNPAAWMGWVETPSSFKRFNVNLLRDFDPGSGVNFYKPDDTGAIAAARSTFVFQRFLEFDIYPRWSVLPAPEPEGGKRVELHDLRFSFRAIAILDRGNRVVRSWFEL